MSSYKRVLEETVQVIPRYTGDPARTYKPDYHPRYKPRDITYVPLVGAGRKAPPPPSPRKFYVLGVREDGTYELLKSGLVEQHGSWVCLPGTAPEGLRKKPAPSV